MFLLFDDGELIVTIMGIVSIGVDGGFVSAVIDEIESNMNSTSGLVGNAADVPVVGVAVFSGDDIIFANFASEGNGFLEIGWDGADKFKFGREAFFVDEGTVGGHLHSRIDSDKISELTGEGGGHAFDTVGEVKNATSVIHATGQKTGVR